MLYDWKKLYDESVAQEKIPLRYAHFLFPIVADYSDMSIIEFNHYNKLIQHGKIIEIEYEKEYNELSSSSKDLY